MSLLSFVELLQASSLGAAIRDSAWLFPVIESGHLVGLAVIGGAVIVVDLRLLGFGLTQLPVRVVARNAHRWLIWALLALVVTGLLLFVSEAVKCYYSPAFWLKMYFLAAALAFTLVVRQRVIMASHVSPWWGRCVACVSLTLWTGVGFLGRAIGFY